MKTVVIKEVELPLLPPKGWKKKVAEAAGCCEKTVYNALRGNIKGPQANKVLEVYKQLFGKVTKSEIVNYHGNKKQQSADNRLANLFK